MKINRSIQRLLLGGFCALTAGIAAAQTNSVEKIADLATGVDGNSGLGFGPSVPECRFTLVGTNLWFTSNLGGALGAGGVFSFDLSSSNVTQLATFDGSTGNKPWAASVMIANGLGWFTTSAGGTGAKGSLCSIDLTNFTVSNVFNFPTNADFGWNPHSTPIQIGNDLWFTTSAGGLLADGVTTAYGAIVKYSLTNNTLTNVFSLDATNSGRQPLGSSLVPAGNAYYFLTFAGGTNVAGGTPNGAGILGKIIFNNLNQPTLAKVLDLPGRFVSFPAGDPVFDGTNFLYFTTAGVAMNPGAILRYNLTDGTLTSLFNFVTNAVASTNFGKQPYGTPVLYNNELFFTTFSGGTVGKGVLAKLNLASNTFTKLADFEQTAGLALGGSPQYNGGTVCTNPVTGRIGIYFPITRGGVGANGGALGNGTIVRVDLPPPPIVAALQNNFDGTVTLSWTGGYSPFNVAALPSFSSGIWTSNWLSGLNTNVVTLSATNHESYFRVGGAGQ